jgi:hypothetical protein
MNGRKTRRGGDAPLFVVDAEFAEQVGRWSWCDDGQGYLRATVNGKSVRLHRFVWSLRHGSPPSMLDHINGARWDCRIENLRPANHSLNGLNKTRARTTHQLPRGVHNDKSNKTNPYYARLHKQSLGSFPTPEQASEAYESALNREITSKSASISHTQGTNP